MKQWKQWACSLFLILSAPAAFAFDKPVLLESQGSFFAGGTTVQAEGTYDFSHPTNPAGQTLHGDHAYVFYQKPVHARQYPLVFLHGAGQSGKTWETTPDGRDGFQNIFLSRQYSTYVVDQPRRGRAGKTAAASTEKAVPNETFWRDNFRISKNGAFYENVQMPTDDASIEQFDRQSTPNTGAYDEAVIANAVAAVFQKSGPGILVTHSQGGGPGWRTAMQSDNVRAIVAFEPGSGFVFPEGEVPAPLQNSSPFGALTASAIPLQEFLKLTKIPIVIYYGDHIADKPTADWNEDSWRVRLQMARLFADAINRHGGDATVVHLPEIGIKGNTHFPFADKNNAEIANVMEQWLHEKNLDRNPA